MNILFLVFKDFMENRQQCQLDIRHILMALRDIKTKLI